VEIAEPEIYVALLQPCSSHASVSWRGGNSSRKELLSYLGSGLIRRRAICCLIWSPVVDAFCASLSRTCSSMPPCAGLYFLACLHQSKAPKVKAETTPIAIPAAAAGPHVYCFEAHRLYGIEQRPKRVACSADLNSRQKCLPGGGLSTYTKPDSACGSLLASVIV
jgi:hypothetical protein